MAAPAHIFSDSNPTTSFASTADLSLTGGGTTAGKIVFVMLGTSSGVGPDATNCVINPSGENITMTRLTAHNMAGSSSRPVSVWVFYDGLGGIDFPDGDITIRGTWANSSYRPQIVGTLWGGAVASPPYSGDNSAVGASASSHSNTVTVPAESQAVVLVQGTGGITITETSPTSALEKSSATYSSNAVLTKTGEGSITLNWTSNFSDIECKFGVSINGGTPTPAITDITASDTSAVITYTNTATHYRLDGGSGIAIGASPATITGLTANTEYTIEISPDNSTWYSSTDFGTENPAGMGSGATASTGGTMNDVKNSFLTGAGYSGSIDDKTLKYWLAEGATTKSRVDAEKEYLVVKGYSTGSLQDRWKAYLISLGYTGSLNDMFKKFWENL